MRGLVIDDDSVRVLGNLQVQFVSASGRVSVRSSSRRYFELQPRDTTGMVVRVMRKDSLLLDLPLSQMQFGKAFGHRLAVMLSEKGSRVVMESSSCMG